MSIDAAEWIERASVAPEVFERWPSYRVVLVASNSVDADRLAAVGPQLFDEAHELARSASADVAPHIGSWHDAYRDFGVKPRVARVSVDALLRRAAAEDGLPRITPLVDAYNAVSMLHCVPIGGEDLDGYRGPARLILASGTEPFLTRAAGEVVTEHPDPAEPVWVDDEGVTCRRWNWRQTTRTAIHDSTRRVGFIVDSLEVPDHAGASAAADRLADLLIDPIVRVIDMSG